jgi:hypothetical protein
LPWLHAYCQRVAPPWSIRSKLCAPNDGELFDLKLK